MSCARKNPLALFVCCGVAGLAGLAADDAVAQGMTPLRVDPVLLGLPPAEKKPPAAPEKATEPAAEKARAEVKPVDTQAVESKSLPTDAEAEAAAASKPKAAPARAASPDKIPARAVAPAEAPAAVAPAPSAPMQSSSPVVAAPAPRPREQETVPATRGAPGSTQPVSPTRAEPPAGKVTTLAPLQVHPGLLDPSAVAAAPAPVAAGGAAPSKVAGRPASAPTLPPGVSKVTTLAPLRVHPGLLGLPAMAGAPVPGAVAAGAPATLAGLAQNEQDAWRAGRPPVLNFPRESIELPDGAVGVPALRAAKTLAPLQSGGLPRPMFLTADELAGIADRETVATGNAEARQAGTVVNADRLTYWPVEDELEAAGNVRMAQAEDLVTGPRMRMKLGSQTGVFDEPTYSFKREAKWAAKERERQEKGVKGSTPVNASGEAAWQQAATAFKMSRPEPGSLMNVLGVSAEEPDEIPKTTATGNAERIDFEGENKMRIFNGNYTTCQPDDPGWYVRSDELALDYDREVGEGRNSTVYFQNTPIFWTPWMSFSLNNNRKSGFLSPTFGSSTVSGLSLSTPYYWNIAPHMDATISPRIYSKRGLQMAGEFRYLDYNFSSNVRAEYLPNDRQADGDNRYGYSLRHLQNFGRGVTGTLNISGVSDDKYFTDLSSRSVLSSQRQLLRQGVLSYGGELWSANVIGQSYQALNPDTDPAQRIGKSYSYAPQVNLTARRPDFYYSDLAFTGQYTVFTHPDANHSDPSQRKDEGRRLVAYPQLALPIVQPGWYVTPKVGMHMTSYSLDRRAPNSVGSESISRSLPIYSVDAGMTFERETSWFGAPATQTLEPRLYYLNVPYKNQSLIPNFDSGVATFDFAQIFGENQFAGYDRVSDANQLTAAVVSRLIDPTSGAEAMRAMFGQRYYFQRQRVDLQGQTIPGTTRDKWNRSDFLAAFSGRVLPKTWLDAALQYNPADQRMERSSIGARYQPELGKTLNVSYRFASNQISSGALKNVDVAGQWPIWGGWSAVGRYNYSILDHKPVETVAGLEYNAGCWAVRFVSHQVATLSERTNTSFFVQLELNDFARIGSNPIDLLRRNIQGYGLANQPVADPVFGE
ncbi:MAG: LPS-assembly protein LptD [Rhodocyclales bacterium]|nr:LPS-assembly protein LptD [Rhodocyclales bacterium]